MGFFSNIVSGFSRAVSSAYDTVRSVVRSAISTIAEKGDAFIGSIKETYAKVKPYLQKVSPFLEKMAVAVTPSAPWLASAIRAVSIAVTGLLALENSPILRELERAMKWVIERAKELDKMMTAQEEAEAREHQETLRKTKAYATTEEQVAAIDVAAMINELALVKTGIANLIEDGKFTSFEHYLRLRATQKMMRSAEDALATARTIEQISPDDIFLIHLGANLLASDPKMSEEEAQRLDQIVMRRFGKKLTPFVFEEMQKMWQLALTEQERQWKRTASKLATGKATMNRLKLEALVSTLSPDEQSLLDKLLATLPAEIAANDDLRDQNVEREHYISATEGFLQLLEKTPEELAANNQQYLADEGAQVGLLLTECAHKGLRWKDLTEEQQCLIADYANIFRADSVKRGNELEVECNG